MEDIMSTGLNVFLQKPAARKVQLVGMVSLFQLVFKGKFRNCKGHCYCYFFRFANRNRSCCLRSVSFVAVFRMKLKGVKEI